jgi:hypothetical protein
VINNPFLSLITATPMEYVQDLLGNLEIDGGFLNRFITITGKVQGWKAIARPPESAAWGRFASAVRGIRSHYESGCEFTWGEAGGRWIEFYNAWKTKRQDWNTRDQKLTARIDEHITKLALVYSIIKKQSAIDDDALLTAIKIGKWLNAIALNAFSGVGVNPFSKAEKTVLDIVKSKRKMYRRYLQQWVYKKGIDGDLLDRVIRSLVKNGHLTEGKEMTGSGRERPWVEYIQLTVNT